MNTLLEKLFEQHNIDMKDRLEIRQMFMLVDDRKKQNILNNFNKLANGIREIDRDISYQRYILLGDAVSSVEEKILDGRRGAIKNNTKREIRYFKQDNNIF